MEEAGGHTHTHTLISRSHQQPVHLCFFFQLAGVIIALLSLISALRSHSRAGAAAGFFVNGGGGHYIFPPLVYLSLSLQDSNKPCCSERTVQIENSSRHVK